MTIGEVTCGGSPVHVNVIKLKCEIIWTGRLPHLLVVHHLYVNRPSLCVHGDLHADFYVDIFYMCKFVLKRQDVFFLAKVVALNSSPQLKSSNSVDVFGFRKIIAPQFSPVKL